MVEVQIFGCDMNWLMVSAYTLIPSRNSVSCTYLNYFGEPMACDKVKMGGQSHFNLLKWVINYVWDYVFRMGAQSHCNS